MKRALLLITFVLAASVAGWAGACAPATMSTYDNPTFSCSIGPLLFSNFTYAIAPIGGQPTDAQVMVTPVPSGPEIGFTFDAPSTSGWSVSGADQFVDAGLTFVVSCANGSNCITDIVLTMVGSATGSGIASVAETNLDPSGPNVFLLVYQPNGPLSQQQFFSGGVSSLHPGKDIGATTGDSGGTAQVSSVQNLFSTTFTPEPASLALLGTALFGAGLMLRRRLRADESKSKN